MDIVIIVQRYFLEACMHTELSMDQVFNRVCSFHVRPISVAYHSNSPSNHARASHHIVSTWPLLFKLKPCWMHALAKKNFPNNLKRKTGSSPSVS